MHGDRGSRIVARSIATAQEPAVVMVVGAVGGVALRYLHQQSAALDLADYRSWFIGEGLLKAQSVPILLIQSAFVAALLPRQWSDYRAGSAARWVVGAAVTTLALGFTLYRPNEYLGRFHLLDRVILLGLAVGVLRRVALLPVFTLYCWVIVEQFQWPLSNYSWTDKQAIFEILLAVQCVFAWQALVRPRRLDARPALVASMVVLGSWYLSAGIDKLRLGWLGKTHLSNLVKAAWVEGWLRFLPVGFLDGVADIVSFLNPVLLVGTLAIELGCVVLLFTTPRLRTVALASLVALHLSIFALTGIFFWKWVAVEVVLGVVLARERFTIDRRSALAAGATTLFLSPVVAVNLAWVDSPVVHAFSVIAVAPDGRDFVVPERYFQPFELTISQDRFGYLTDQPLVSGAFGTLDPSIDSGVLEDLTAANLAELRENVGTVRYSETAAGNFDDFVRRQCHTWIDRRRLDGWPLFPPPHIWTTDPVDNGPPPSQIDHVIVRLDTWLLDRLPTGPVDSDVVRRIDIDDHCTG